MLPNPHRAREGVDGGARGRDNGPVRIGVILAALFGAAAAAVAPAAAQVGLPAALERQDVQRSIQQLELRRETERQGQEIQRQLDQGRVQQQIERQLMLRQAPVPCPFSRPTAGC
jgi:hypothetical protein